VLDYPFSPSESANYFITRKPVDILSPYIDIFWICRAEVRANGRDRMLPTGTASLIVNLLEDEVRVYDSDTMALSHRLEGASFEGVHKRTYVIDTAEQAYVAGISFHPGGAWPFMRCAQDELSNQHIPLRDIWGLDIASLRERMLLAPTPQAQLSVLENTLLESLQRPLNRHPAVSLALATIQRDPSGTRIARLSQQSSLSTRRVTRLFEQEVGLTPKLYARLLRFRQILRHAWQKDGIDWTELALSCGYADQPHFVRDFKAFSGFTPTQYQSYKGEFENHIPIK
jgi:AraC-like DNA-binding protein